MEKEVELGTLYDINKSIVQNNEIKLSEGIINSKKEIVKNYISSSNNCYYMLLCHERRDYTVFNLHGKDPMEMSKCLIDECLINRGEIRGIDITKDKQAVEIWLSIEGESYAYYLFPYDNGVIEF